MPQDEIPLGPGDHACHLYESSAEQKNVVLSFVRQGLENGEHCLYVTSEQPVDDWYLEFQAYGIDVERERQRGALQVIDRDNWRPPGSNFNSMLQARKVLALIDRLLSDFKGLRIAGDAAWALNPDLAVGQLCHWEATANLIYTGQEIRAICHYDLRDHSPAAVHTALRTHPLVILDGLIRSNPYYDAPKILESEPLLNDSEATASDIDGMLARLRDPASPKRSGPSEPR